MLYIIIVVVIYITAVLTNISIGYTKQTIDICDAVDTYG